MTKTVVVAEKLSQLQLEPGQGAIASGYDLWWSDRPPEQPALIPSCVRLTNEFFREITSRAGSSRLGGHPAHSGVGHAPRHLRMAYLPNELPISAIKDHLEPDSGLIWQPCHESSSAGEVQEGLRHAPARDPDVLPRGEGSLHRAWRHAVPKPHTCPTRTSKALPKPEDESGNQLV
jgi:hypothetical protein